MSDSETEKEIEEIGRSGMNVGEINQSTSIICHIKAGCETVS